MPQAAVTGLRVAGIMMILAIVAIVNEVIVYFGSDEPLATAGVRVAGLP